MAWAVRLGFIFFTKLFWGFRHIITFLRYLFLYIFYPTAGNDRSAGGKRDPNFIVVLASSDGFR